MLGDQRIPAPPIKEQAKIADTLDELNKLSLECIKRCEESIILLQERRTALISAAVTGKIDVRNWNLGIDERSTFLSCKGNGG
jgi:type I restriction enzyme S subunit